MSGQKRILGIDYGTRRVGVAISDPLRLLATAYASYSNNKELLVNLKTVVDKEDVEFIVVGMPLNLKGEKARAAQEVEEFIARLKESVGREVVSWDERFTTSMAQQTLLAFGTKKKERKARNGRVDSMAAALLLQGFLDSTKKSMSC